MSNPSCGPIRLGVKCCPGSSFAGPRPRPPRFAPPPPPPLLLSASAPPPFLPAAGRDDGAEEGGGGGVCSRFPLLPAALLPSARLNEKEDDDDPRTRRLSRLLPLLPLPLPLPPSLLPPPPLLDDDDDEEGAAACACDGASGRPRVPRREGGRRLWGGLRRKARPGRHADAAYVCVCECVCMCGVVYGSIELGDYWVSGHIYVHDATHAPAPRRAPP